MSKRLQVILDDTEYREITQAARRNGVSVSEWVLTFDRAFDALPGVERVRDGSG